MDEEIEGNYVNCENFANAFVFIAIILFISYVLNLSYQKDFMAMKYGYIQQVKNGKIIWVKPEQLESNIKGKK